METDILIIGAGVAGLTAAHHLQQAGVKTAVLEAGRHIGGRIHTIHDPAAAEPAELGAEFVHGEPPEIADLLEPSFPQEEIEGDDLCFDEGEFRPCEGLLEEVEQLLFRAEGEPDMPFEKLLEQSTMDEVKKRRARLYIEGFNAADVRRIGVQGLIRQQRAEGERIARLRGGYDAIPRLLSAGLNVRLKSPVEVVRWKTGSVQATARQESWQAKRAVITVPLGVLQAGGIRFEPAPPGILEAAGQLAMGPASRLTFRFDERIWMRHQTLATASFIHVTGEPFPAWWSRGQLITAWAGGAQAESLRAHNPAAMISLALETLARLTGESTEVLRANLAAVHYHDWNNDPLTRGAYSYVPAGALAAVEALGKPVDRTLYFAGEATDPSGNWGTVQGAIRSGLRAAEAILADS